MVQETDMEKEHESEHMYYPIVKEGQLKRAMHALFALRALAESREDRSAPYDAIIKQLGFALRGRNPVAKKIEEVKEE